VAIRQSRPAANRVPALLARHGHALIIEANNRSTDVDLKTSRVVRRQIGGVHPPGFLLHGRVVNAVWTGPHTLAVAEAVVEREDEMARPYGVEIVDTRTWRARVVDTTSSAVAFTHGTLLAFGGPGITGYSPTGTRRFVLLDRQRVDRVVTTGSRYAYADLQGQTEVIDTRTGRATLALAGPGFVAGLLP
jgi:hypothetical protein